MLPTIDLPPTGGFQLRHRDGDASKIHAIPANLRRFLAPAEWVIYEWTPYVVEWTGATALQIGSIRQNMIAPGVFLVTFENQLGLTRIHAYDQRGAIGGSIAVEVIASKFQSPAQSVDFLRGLLSDLFARVAASPFVLGATTERMVRESYAPPNPLFAFHFFRHHGTDLVRALQVILAHPLKRLAADPELVRPHEVRQVDQESLIRMLRAGRPSPVAMAGNIDSMTPLQRLRPERIWQQIPAETFDTPENRFVLSACRHMLSSIHSLQKASWYGEAGVGVQPRRQIARVAEQLGMVTQDDRFALLGPMAVMPAHSRALQKRDGYHELAALWQLFQRSRQPIFEHMQQAIDLRNVADLYEFWVWFELIDRIRECTATQPVHLHVHDVFGSPGWTSRVNFDAHGVLHYNRTFSGYSGISLRPDYVWERADGSLIVMDAKFRMQRPGELLDETRGEDGSPLEQRAKADDLQKMHAYRDAIRGVKAAVVIYPGNVSLFRSTERERSNISLADLLTGDFEGVGAIPMSPIATPQGEEFDA